MKYYIDRFGALDITSDFSIGLVMWTYIQQPKLQFGTPSTKTVI